MIFFDPTVIRALRKAHKLTLAELAKRVDVTASTISAWENGDSKLSAKDLASVANVFDVNTSLFYKQRRIKNDKSN